MKAQRIDKLRNFRVEVVLSSFQAADHEAAYHVPLAAFQAFRAFLKFKKEKFKLSTLKIDCATNDVLWFIHRLTNLEAVHPSFVVSFVAVQSVVVHLFRPEPYVVDLVHQRRVLVLEVQPVHSTNWLAFLYQQRDRYLDLVLSQELELVEDLLLGEEVCRQETEIKLNNQFHKCFDLNYSPFYSQRDNVLT